MLPVDPKLQSIVFSIQNSLDVSPLITTNITVISGYRLMPSFKAFFFSIQYSSDVSSYNINNTSVIGGYRLIQSFKAFFLLRTPRIFRHSALILSTIIILTFRE